MRIQYLICVTLLLCFKNNHAQLDTTIQREFNMYSTNYFHIGSTHFPIGFYSTLLNGGFINDRLKGEFKTKDECLRMGGEAQTDICIEKM